MDKNYCDLQQKAQEAGEGRSVLIDKQVGSVWYVPGGQSTIGQMVKDASGRYPWADDDHSGSLSMPFERVLEEAFDTEVWMYRYDSDKPMTFDDLLAEKEGYKEFRAFETREVYGCNVRTSLFYEESPFHPDRLLSDFIQILHPDIKGLPPLHYYKKAASAFRAMMKNRLVMQAPPLSMTDYSHCWDFFVPKVGMFYSQCGNVLSSYWF